MGGRIPAEAIQHIRERASLIEVVSDVVTLRKRGRTVVGLCPFHTEKTPSFTVSEERGFYHCFGCGEHGDVFGFVMKTQSLAFPEAIRAVAQRFGLPVPEGGESERRGGDPLLAVNAAAAAFFRKALAAPGGTRARAYLAERGVGDEIAARFGLGYAPGTGDALARQLRSDGHPVEHALTLGLVSRRDSGGVYDRFRDRLMFPIADATGRIVAFGGRILPGGRASAGDAPPKYLNSPESPLFHKGHMLYGLPQARDAIRRRAQAIVVEGYLDVIALAEAGIEEVVAPLGTALTADQLRVLRRLCDAVVACFDGDDAGRRAAARSFATFVEAGLWGRGVFLPAGEDPDTFVRRQGREALETLVASAEPLVDAFLADLAGPRRDAVARNVEAAKDVARILKRVRSPLEFEVLVHLAAERLRVREELLRGEGMPAAEPAGNAPAAADRAPGPEERLVEIMAMDATAVARVVEEGLIAELDHPTWRSAAQALAAASGEEERTAVVRGLPRETQDRIARRMLADASEMNHEAEAIGCIAQIHARSTDRELKRLQEAMRSAEARGDEATADEARRRFWALKTQSTEKSRGHRSPT